MRLFRSAQRDEAIVRTVGVIAMAKDITDLVDDAAAGLGPNGEVLDGNVGGVLEVVGDEVERWALDAVCNGAWTTLTT